MDGQYTSERLSTGTETLQELAGLINAGVDEDGDIEWLGTDAQRARYRELLRENEGMARSIDLDDDHDCHASAEDGCLICGNKL